MNIGLTAHNSKKALLESFCFAYKGILRKHHLIATNATGGRIEKNTGLPVEKLLPGLMGGAQQMRNMIMNHDLDMVIFFYSVDEQYRAEEDELPEISRLCDVYNIPFATNIATAESLIQCLGRGELETRY